MAKASAQEWLLIFYSVPSHPVSNRMKIWRKLAQAGAVQLKGAVYILPATEEHEEFFQWLISEVKSMKGDGAFVRTAEIKAMDESDIRDLFLRQSDKEYRNFEKNVDVLERKVQSIRKGASSGGGSALADYSGKLTRELDDVRKRDFFSSSLGTLMQKRMQSLVTALRGMSTGPAEAPSAIRQKRTEEYQGRTWVTRKKPFIDRMASAWLIRRFIDGKATFSFVDESRLRALAPEMTAFDMRGAEFTHVGDLCTFEVLVRSFNIKDKAVRKMAEIVHDLDVKDDKYGNSEAAGVENILSGIRKTAKSDNDALEGGMDVFEMLYQSRT
jgi:hypothetical protein